MKKLLSLTLLLTAYCLLLTFPSHAKDYDGIWFMGYNLQSKVLGISEVRKAISCAIDKKYIVKTIVSEEVVPESVIPPTMIGYDADLVPPEQDLSYAKLLMQKVGLPINDQRLKRLSLLHTDGLKTKAIAQKLQADLKNIGLKVSLVEVPYLEHDQWVAELTSGKHDFFLMGYKAGLEALFSTAEAAKIDSYSLVEPLFKTNGEANFTGFSNKDVDRLLNQLSQINFALTTERHGKLKQINQLLVEGRPVEVLFYIEKI